MWYGNGWVLGMHYLWWVFWILVIAILVVMLTRGRPRENSNPAPPTPLEILERRYAAGEISTQEFEERKARLTSTNAIAAIS